MKIISMAILTFNLIALGASTVYAADMADMKEDQAKDKYHATKKAVKTEYEMAKERCEAMNGNAEDVCMKDAKAKYQSDKANAKAMKKAEKAQIEADETSMKAEYKAARERCDTLNGSAKDACIAQAKQSYPK